MSKWIRTIALAVFSVVFFSGCAVTPLEVKSPLPGKTVLFGGPTFATDVLKHPCTVDERRDNKGKVVYYVEKCTEEYTLGPYRCIRTVTKMTRNGVAVPQRPQEPRCWPLATQMPVEVAPRIEYPPRFQPRPDRTVVPREYYRDSERAGRSVPERAPRARLEAPLRPVSGADCKWRNKEETSDGHFWSDCTHTWQERGSNMVCTKAWRDLYTNQSELVWSDRDKTEKRCKPQEDDEVSPNRRKR